MRTYFVPCTMCILLCMSNTYICTRIRHHIPTATILPYQILEIKQKGVKTIRLWYKFHIGILIAVTGVKDKTFENGGLENLSINSPQDVGKLTKWPKEMVCIGKTFRKLILLGTTRGCMLLWEQYLLLMAYWRLGRKNVPEDEDT
jgi:hypothetical protein